MAKKSKKKSRKTSKKKVTKFKTKKKAVKKVKKSIKKVVKKAKKAQKPTTKKAAPAKIITKKPLGEVVHFYPNISVGVVELKSELKIGDIIMISGHGQSFEQKVTSMQVEHQSISVAKKGQVIGMKVAQPVKEKDLIYKK